MCSKRQFLVVLSLVILFISCQSNDSADTNQSINHILKNIINKYNKLNNECIYSDTLFHSEFVDKPTTFKTKAGKIVKILPEINHANRSHSVISYYSFQKDTAKITLFKESCGAISRFRLLKLNNREWIILDVQEFDI